MQHGQNINGKSMEHRLQIVPGDLVGTSCATNMHDLQTQGEVLLKEMAAATTVKTNS